jgi:Ran GTPase-activating protein (RanGAP) involved in mRNA processing and transport
MVLGLADNAIGAQGAQYLANVLQRNTVRQVFSHRLYIHYYDLTQTLTTLDLNWNKVGEKGVQYLANALQSNTVRHFFVLISYKLSTTA